jgi:hypothetical protein
MRQPTPSMELTAILMSLEGQFLNWREGIISESSFQAQFHRHLSRIKALQPHLDVGAWMDISSGQTSSEFNIKGGPLDGVVLKRMSEKPSPKEIQQIVDAGVAFIMNKPHNDSDVDESDEETHPL